MNSDIPTELQDLPQWVAWKFETRDGRATKVPYSPATGKRASVTEPGHWTTYQSAAQYSQNKGFEGVMFALTNQDPYTVIDLDAVMEQDSYVVSSEIAKLIGKFNSRTEVSPSGSGLHVIMRAKPSGPRCRTGAVEIYYSKRFITMTGRLFPGAPAEIHDRQKELESLYRKLFVRGPVVDVASQPEAAPVSLDDKVLIEKASRSSLRFSELWRGDVGGFGSRSEADYSLCQSLAFWTGRDHARIDLLFRQSGLMREKWNRDDYRDKTIETACANTTNVYEARVERSTVQGSNDLDAVSPKNFQPFPLASLPSPLRELVSQGSDAIGCDPALIALPLLAATAAGIGNSHRVRLKPDWTEPTIIWAASVCASGSAKSPAMALAIDPIERCERRLRAENRTKFRDWKKRHREWRKNGEEGDEPEQPPQKRLLTRDCTLPALAGILEQNPRGLLLPRDELGAWLEGMGRFNQTGEVAHWLELYQARPILIDRKTAEAGEVYVPAAHVSITGGIQPGIFRRLMGEKNFENGLAARLLLSMPPERLRVWTDACVDTAVTTEVERLFETLLAWELEAGPDGIPQPRELAISDQAKEVFVEFYNRHNQVKLDTTDERLKAGLAKLEGYTARFALVIECVKAARGSVMPTIISGESMKEALELEHFFENEMRRIYSLMSESEAESFKKRIVSMAKNRGGSITKREAANNGILKGDSHKLDRIMGELVEEGLGRWETKPPGVGGGRPSISFVLAPGL